MTYKIKIENTLKNSHLWWAKLCVGSEHTSSEAGTVLEDNTGYLAFTGRSLDSSSTKLELKNPASQNCCTVYIN